MKKKLNFMQLLSLLFVLIGITLFAYHFTTTYLQNRELNKIKDQFQQLLDDPNPDTSDDVLLEENIWGMLKIDSVDIDLPIAIADNFDGLYTSLVAYDTSPVPPNEGNFAIAGHNGSCPVCTFRYLHDTEEGDTIELTSRDATYIYEIYAVRENVMNTETSVLDPVPDETTLTLITCQYSSWTNPLRLIVHARLVEIIPKRT